MATDVIFLGGGGQLIDVICERNFAISEESVVGFPSPSLCCPNLSTFEGVDAKQVTRLKWADSVQAGSEDAASHGMKHQTKPKGQVFRKKHRIHFYEATSVFCVGQNDEIISKESSLLLLIQSLVYSGWEFGLEPRILPDSSTNVLRQLDSNDNGK